MPLIKKLATKDTQYIYDVGTNQFVRVDHIVNDIIDDIYILRDKEIIDKWESSYDANNLSKALEKIRSSMMHYRLFSNLGPREFRPTFSREEILDALNHAIMNLCFEVTQDCNMRCKYCTYSGSFYYQRRHKQISMSFDMARRIIDYYMRHSNKSLNRFISFFGGEPLLSIELIRQCVGYISKIYDVKNIHFGITTNGLLLNREIIEYLCSQRFNITLSLDGPADLHDKYRTKINGKGSYDQVIGNLHLLMEAVEYGRIDHFLINVCIAPEHDVERQMEYFDNIAKHKGVFLNVFFAETNESSLLKGTEDKKAIMNQGLRNVRKIYQNQLCGDDSKPSPFLNALFGRSFSIIHRRKKCLGFDDSIHPNGMCIPGWEKMFVDPYGEIRYCEKMAEMPPIGDIKNGIDIDKVFMLINDYVEICNTDCRGCWALRFCRACFFNMRRERKICREEKREQCAVYKEALQKDLIFYLETRKIKENAFSYIDRETRYNYVDEYRKNTGIEGGR